MTWARGENASLAGFGPRFRAGVRSAAQVDVCALLLTSSGSVRSEADFVFYNQPEGDGVALRRAADGERQVIEFDLDVIMAKSAAAEAGARVHKIIIVVSVDGETQTFGGVAQQTVYLDQIDGGRVGTFTMAGLSTERAVIALEVYLRSGTWKVRAVGQGYDGGLAALVTAHGVAVEQQPVRAEQQPMRRESAEQQPAGLPIHFSPGHHAVPDTGLSAVQERMYVQFLGIFEDAARSAAAFESASDFAHHRLEQELSAVVADQTTRHAPETAAGRFAAQRRHDELVAKARVNYLRDAEHLRVELAELAGSVPAPMASWDDPTWRHFAQEDRIAAGIRIGTLHREGRDGPVVPFILRLPMARPLWIDTGGGQGVARGQLAQSLATSVLARILAGYPAGAMTVSVIDLAGGGAGTRMIGPLLAADTQPVAAGTRPVGSIVGSVPALGQLLAELVSRVDMAHMAVRADAIDALASHGSSAAHLLVWYDFPVGLDERGMNSVRFLMEHGPTAGVFMVLVADAGDAVMASEQIEALSDAALRLAPTPSECVADPWVGLLWTYTPDIPGSEAPIDQVMTLVAQARR